MIPLHQPNGNAVFIKAEAIIRVRTDSDGATVIDLAEGIFQKVTESVADVLAKLK